jgi:mono/diheme cytochrome c family protein
MMSREGIGISVIAHRRGFRRGAFAALALTAVLVAGCGGGGSSSTESTGTETTASGASPASNSSTAETGKAVFQAQCSSCHKLAAAKATFATYGPDLDKLKPSQGAVEQQVTNGGGIMQAYGKNGLLTASEIKAVATYVAAEAGK